MKYATLSSLVITTFWLLQVNPLSIWVMSESSGLGYGAIRSSLYISGISIIVAYIAFQHLTGAMKIASVTKDIVRFFWMFAGIVFVRIFLDLLIYGTLDFVGVFPFIEFIISLFIFSKVDVYKFINNNINRIRHIASLVMIADIGMWGYSIISGVSFGVFRANISGIELNRMADLFYAGIASFFLIDKESKLIFRTIALICILSTLYRSAYLATFGVLLYYCYIIKIKINLSKIINIFIPIIVASLAIAIIGGWFFDDFILIDVLLERFLSTFLSEADVYGEASKSQRIDQILPLIYAFLNNILIGTGYGYYLLGEPIYNYFNYVLIALVIFGLPLIFSLIIPVIYLLRKLFLTSRGQSNPATLFVNSMVIYSFILINVFPYMIYFPICSVFAFAICYHIWAGLQFNSNNAEKIKFIL